ncbi:hypothetical protein CRV08_12295 [Halarcobacter ebronensis]|uniref:Glycosyltransferase 2-like domain-containing protein n=1 Tax=Halarcobacter ebronensis TaxID=1462615 RepID=A0A4Q0YCM7_9BACT|nr:glycosyltransferase family 2 protein [Halarcobacter ebronensis]RXJ66839.1 hypothetical protein CRV08_12295 [Halarcobacter ebronensis]
MNPLISVIIPVYNSEQYLPRAINSVLNSSLIDNIEIIVIDDASQGNCKEIIKQYSSQNIKYIRHEKNKGLFQARYTGIINAQGEYIAHLDSDDWIESTIYETLYTYAKKNNQDIVMFNMRNVDNQNKIYYNSHEIIFPFENKTGQNLIDEILLANTYSWTLHACWNKLIKTNTIKKTLKDLKNVPHLNLAEDLLWSISIYLQLKDTPSISAIDDIGLNYYIHNDSITKNNSIKNLTKKISDTKLVYFYIKKLFNKSETNPKSYKYLERTKYYELNSLLKLLPFHKKIYYFSFYLSYNIFYKIYLDQFVLEESGNIVLQKLKEKNIQNVSIYGLGTFSMYLYEKIKKSNIDIDSFILSHSSEKNLIDNIPILKIDDLKEKNIPNIIIASIGSYQQIKHHIKINKIKTSNILGVFE